MYDIKRLQQLAGINPQQLEEGWKEVMFVGALALSNLLGGSLKAQNIADISNVSNKDKTEILNRNANEKKEFYAILVGALAEMAERMGSNKTIEELNALKEARIYFENLRDGITPTPLSKLAEIAVNHVLKVLKSFPGEKLKQLAEKGKNLKTYM